MNKGTMEKRIETLEGQARADKWAVYLAWLEGLSAFVMPDFNAETAVETDAALALRFPELERVQSREEDEHEAHEAALDAAEEAGMTRDQIMQRFDPPRPPSIAARLECQRFAAITAGILSSEMLSADERAFLLSVKASHEWAARLEGHADPLTVLTEECGELTPPCFECGHAARLSSSRSAASSHSAVSAFTCAGSTPSARSREALLIAASSVAVSITLISA